MKIRSAPKLSHDRGLLSFGSSAAIALFSFFLLGGLAIVSDRGSKAYGAYQNGLLVLIVLTVALIPVRLRLSRERGLVSPYPGSARFWIDVLLATAALIAAFVLDLNELPSKGLRVGVASAIAFVIAISAAWLGRRKR